MIELHSFSLPHFCLAVYSTVLTGLLLLSHSFGGLSLALSFFFGQEHRFACAELGDDCCSACSISSSNIEIMISPFSSVVPVVMCCLLM